MNDKLEPTLNMTYSILFDTSFNSIKHHLNDEDWIFVDLRSDVELIAYPMIKGFKQIAFYETIIDAAILDYNGSLFHASALKNEKRLRELFPKNKNIVLICRRGIRAQYIKEALMHLNYTHVFNVGSIHDYT